MDISSMKYNIVFYFLISIYFFGKENMSQELGAWLLDLHVQMHN
jgi:hypothetical protein